MKTTLMTLTFLCGIFIVGKGQIKDDETSKDQVWSEADRKYLLDNLIRSREEILAETKGLTKEQWNFKESPDRWSINQIIEHICIWELIAMNEISTSLQMGPIPNFAHYLPDSLFVDADPEGENKLITTDYTKPFTYGVPLGNNEGTNNIMWLTTLRNESVGFIASDTRNLRIFYINFGPNIHQKYMGICRHSYKHLRQIQKVKEHPNYPIK